MKYFAGFGKTFSKNIPLETKRACHKASLKEKSIYVHLLSCLIGNFAGKFVKEKYAFDGNESFK